MKDGVPEQLHDTDPKGGGPEQGKPRIFHTNDHVVLDGIFHDLSCQVIQLVRLTDFHLVNKRKVPQTVGVFIIFFGFSKLDTTPSHSYIGSCSKLPLNKA